MKLRIGLGAALLGDPELLILDEPAAGLGTVGLRGIRVIIDSPRGKGVAVQTRQKVRAFQAIQSFGSKNLRI